MDYDLTHGRTYMHLKDKPLYPFGYGLSYTTFAYEGLNLGAPSVAADGAVQVTVKVKNTGARASEALARAVTVLVTPGPAVTMATAKPPVSSAWACAMCTAALRCARASPRGAGRGLSLVHTFAARCTPSAVCTAAVRCA